MDLVNVAAVFKMVQVTLTGSCKEGPNMMDPQFWPGMPNHPLEREEICLQWYRPGDSGNHV